MADSKDPTPPPKTRLPAVRFCLRCLEMWTIRLILLGAVLMAVTLFIFTRTSAAKVWIIPQVEKALGAEVVSGEALITRGGGLSLRDIVFRAPGVDGPAGEFLRADAALVLIDYSAKGGPVISRIALRAPVLRVSIDSENDTVNLAPLLENRPAGKAPSRLPVVTLSEGLLEVGEHDVTGGYTRLKRLRVDGELAPNDDKDASGYTVRLAEVDENGRPITENATLMTGAATTESVEVEIDNFSLEAWPASAAPANIRPILERLNLAGRVDRARFSYDAGGAISAELFLDRVGVSLPFEVADKPDAEQPERDARMRDVSGFVRFSEDRFTARLDGWLEDLPYEVTLAYDGLSADAPFVADLRTRDFRLRERPDLLPFVPPAVEDQLRTFTSPTAVLDAEVRVERRRSGDEGIRVGGWIQFAGGTASYAAFPYEVEDLAGVVIFSPESLEIVEVTGTATNGAEVLARGEFAPPGPTSAVDLEIRVRNMPIDDRLVNALGESRRSTIAALFNETQWETLQAEELTQTTEEKQRVERALETAEAAIGRAQRAGAPVRGDMIASRDELRRMLERPVFDFGGRGEVTITLHREEGLVSNWTRQIDVTLRDVGALPEHFPLPLIADEFRLDINNERALVEAQNLRPVIGGEAVVDAFVRMGTPGPGGLPRVQVSARGVPMHPLLVRAIPDGAEPGSAASVHRMLDELNMTGLLDAELLIAHREGTDKIGYDAEVVIENAIASPARAAVRDADGRTLGLTDIDAAVNVTERRVGVVMTASAMAARSGQGAEPVGEMTALISADLQDDAPPVLGVTVEATEVDVAAPLEDLAWVFSRNAGAAIDTTRETYSPSGTAAIGIGVAGQGFEGPNALGTEIELSELEQLGFDWYEGRTVFSSDAGRVVIDAGARAVAHCRAVAGPLAFEGQPIGYALLRGSVALPAAEDAAGEAVSDVSLDVLLADLPAQSDFASNVMEISAPRGVRDLYRLHQPRGLVQADLLIRPAAGVPNIGFGDDPKLLPHTPVIEGRIAPETLTLDYLGTEIAFRALDGSMLFGPGWSRLDALYAEADGWSVVANGAIEQTPGNEGGPGVAADVTLNMRSQGLPDTLFAVLPPKIQKNLETLQVEVGGEASVEDLRIIATRPSDPHAGRIIASGIVRATGVDAIIGTQISDAEIELPFDSTTPGWFGLEPVRPIPDPSFTFEARSPSGKAAGIRYTNGVAYGVTGDAEEGQIRPLSVDRFSADVHNGRVEGVARVRPIDPDLRETAMTYRTTVRAVGVDVEALLADIAVKNDPTAQPLETLTGSRGWLDADVSIGGLVGRDETRRGRGVVRASGGRLVNAPTIARAVELSNLVPPVGDRIKLAAAEFFIDGGLLTFEEISLLSDSVLLYGYGVATWPDLDLDLRMRSQAVNRVPIVSDLVEGLRDELVTVSVTGNVKEPVVGAQTLATARQVIAGFFGIKPSAADRRLGEIFDRVRERLDRGEGIAGRGADTPTRKPVSRARPQTQP